MKTRMRTLFLLSLAILCLVGCETQPWREDSQTGWRGFTYAEAKDWLSNYPSVLLVCITKDHIGYDPGYAGPIYWFSATVVRVYKGDWIIAERPAFTYGLDYKAKCVTNMNVGTLMFVFTDKHTNVPIAVDTADFEPYNSKEDQLFQSLFLQRPKRDTHHSGRREG